MKRLVVVMALALVVDAAAQDRAQGRKPMLRLDPATATFVLDFVDENGVKQHFVFSPAVGVAPEVRTTVQRDGEAYRYSYVVTNLARAKQELYAFSLTTPTPTSAAGPDGWETGLVNARGGRLSWYRRTVDGGPRRGIPPDSSQDGFTYLSSMLPGPSGAEFRGATGPPRIPEGLPQQAQDELRELMARDFTTRPVIAGVVAGRHGEPDLVLPVFLARVELRYVMHLDRAGHPERFRYLAGIRDAIQRAEAGNGLAAQDVVKKLLAIDPKGLDPWQAELDRALKVCLEYSLTMPLPAP